MFHFPRYFITYNGAIMRYQKDITHSSNCRYINLATGLAQDYKPNGTTSRRILTFSKCLTEAYVKNLYPEYFI